MRAFIREIALLLDFGLSFFQCGSFLCVFVCFVVVVVLGAAPGQ